MKTNTQPSIWQWLPTVAITLMLSANTMAAPKPQVQIAVLLDGSGSMQGLIDQAKNQVWKIINALSDVTKDGEKPDVKIALYEHGKQELSAEGNFLQQLSPLTGEMDAISEKLFAIVANGSQEFTGAAIQSASLDLDWSQEAGDFKAIFIAGNETMEQGPVKLKDAILVANYNDIIVNTMHAGLEEAGKTNLWEEAANLGHGKFVNFDMNTSSAHIETPLDSSILELNKQLNETYIPFGPEGKKHFDRLKKLDEDSGTNLVDRGLSKSQGYYRTASWDLVDAIDQGVVKLEDVKTEDLPEVMRPMTLEERQAHVDQKRSDRKLIQKGILELGKLRQKRVNEELQKLAEEQGATLELVMIETLRAQLAQKGFTLASDSE